MKTIGRNDPCSCGSGKKYKKCCMLKKEIANLGNFRYEKSLDARSSTVEKILKLADGKIGISQADVLSYLTDSPILSERDVDPYSGTEENAIIFQYLLNSLLIYAYPVDSSGIRLWEYCLSKYSARFSEEEVLFLQSLKNFTAGFFQAKEIDPGKYSITAEDIFTLKTYKIMDMGLSSKIKKNDILAGLLIPYDKDSYVLEGGSPIVIPPMKKGYIRDTAENLFLLSKSKLRGDINEKLSRFFKIQPITIYRIVLDHYYNILETPPPKIMTTDNEEIVFSETFYKLDNKQEVKAKLLLEKGFSVKEETGKETVISWLNKKEMIMGTAYLGSDKLRFETNSDERLEKWKSIIKKIPIEFIRTESTDLQTMMEEKSRNPVPEDRGSGKGAMDDIPEEVLRSIAINYWQKYYNEWADIKIPFLDNKTPREAMRTEEGKQKVIDLIDDYENKDAHYEENPAGGSIQKFFDADELRKRLGLLS
jgi:hypothetical protein